MERLEQELLKGLAHSLHRIAERLESIDNSLRIIATEIQQPGPETLPPISINVSFANSKGEPLNMPLLLTDTQQAIGTIAEADAKGGAISPNAANLSVQVSDENVCKISLQSDGTLLATAGAPGTATFTVTDNSTTPPLTVQDTVTVSAGAATTIGVNWGAPSNQ